MFVCFAADKKTVAPDNKAVAAQLARLARKAQDSGQTVRAFLLFSEASAKDPRNSSYRANRDALAPAAHILTQSHVENADISSDIFSAKNEAAHPQPPVELVSTPDWQSLPRLGPLPSVQPAPGTHDFDLRAPAKTLVEQVAAAYGIRALTDTGIQSGKPIRFELSGADFHTALEAVTAATHTFVFAVSKSVIYFAPDTENKRNELEPLVMLTFPLQEALTERDLIEVANAVRGLLGLRTIGWDSANRMVVIRDRAARARVARDVMESLLVPRAQVSFDVQFLTVDTDRSNNYGITLQTLFQFIDFGKIGLQSVLPSPVGATQFLTFGGGATLFGVGVADATAVANFSNSIASTYYDATVVVGDRQTANLHVGDQYPIATSLYTGYTQSEPSIYTPAPQITMEDLGLILKMTPHIGGDGDIGLDLEADYKSLGTQTIDSVPEIAERAFKGTIDLREGQWAIIAGLDSSTETFTRTGWPGIGQIPGIKQILTSTQKESQTSKTLLVIKPTITRLPMTDVLSPEFLLGSRRGERVVI